MNRDLIEYLKDSRDIQVDTHSGSYELVRQGVACLAKASSESIDVNDLLMLFEFGNLGHGKEARDDKISKSNLIQQDKLHMLDLNARINTENYTNHESKSNGNCGLFARGYRQLHINSNKETAQEFIKMLITISNTDDSERMLKIAGECLSANLKGMQAGVASQILHLLKPTVFPILNGPGRNGYVGKLGLPLVKASDIRHYIDNVRIINEYCDKEFPGKNYRTIDVAFWHNQAPKSDVSYWLGGANYGAPIWDVSGKFIENGVYAINFENYDISELVSDSSKLNDWINNLSDSAAKGAFKRFTQIKAGDKIAIKSAFPKKMPNGQKSVSTLRIKAIGVVLNSLEDDYVFDENLGHLLPVRWEIADLKNDFELGKYRDTLHQVTKQEDIDIIFMRKMQYLLSEFLEWLKTQKSQHGKPFSPNTIDQYRGALKNRCRALIDLDIPQPDLFYQTDAVKFRELRDKITKSTYFESENIKAGNGSFSAGMELYEKFLIERAEEKEQHNEYEASTQEYSTHTNDMAENYYDNYTKADFLTEVYMTSEKYNDIAALLDRKKNIILQGAPGVGKSYLAKRLAYSLIGFKDKGKVTTVQFHQSYSYEDFIEGYRPNDNGGFTLKRGIFYEFCEKAKNNDGNYYFIIDEINRGNLSKIMGELMLLIECDKRGEEFAVPLTYSDEPFYVPENVFIIGMMNTADRSLAMIDYALRRRFSFVQIEPAFANPDFITYIKKDNEALGERIIAEMTALNVDIKKDLGAGFQIGHSYFCNYGDINEQWYESVLKYEILPLLDEYWFDNEKQHSKWVKGLLSDEKNPD